MSTEIAALIWSVGVICCLALAPIGFWKTLKVFNKIKLYGSSSLPFVKNSSWSDVTNQTLFWKYIIRKHYSELPDIKLRKQCGVIRNLFILETSIFALAVSCQMYVIFTNLK
jgi:hypothetical protein